MNVNETFSRFLSNYVNLDSDQVIKARSSRDWLIEQIHSFPQVNPEFPKLYSEKDLHYGSFARKTKIRPLDDIDIMIALSAEGSTYITDGDTINIRVLNTVESLLKCCDQGTQDLNSRKIIGIFKDYVSSVPQYGKAEIKRNMEALTLELTSYDWVFDIVPCFYTTPESDGRTFYIIPDGKGKWKKTDPRIDMDRLVPISAPKKGVALNSIRLIKYWNRYKKIPNISSYLLETICLDYLTVAGEEISNYCDVEFISLLAYISTAVLKPVVDPKNIQGDINNLDYDSRKAISDQAKKDMRISIIGFNLEKEQRIEESIQQWIDVFGEEFRSSVR